MFVLLHGFGSTADTSSTIKSLERILGKDNTISITYNYADPHATAKHLYNTIKQILSEHDDVTIIGVSLGGFWARWAAYVFNELSLIMINPSVDAPINVMKYYGTVHNDIKLDYSYSLALEEYVIAKDHPTTSISIIVGKHDDVVNPNVTLDIYKDRAHMFIVNGGHRLTEDSIREPITKSINYICE